MHRSESISKVRDYLAGQELSAIIIPSNDNHFGEYIQDHHKIREWLSGFTGSAGTLVITREKAALWTDSRYFIQAAEQLKGTEIELMKLKVENTPTIEDWLLSHLNSEETVAIDGNLFTYSEYLEYQSSLAPLDIELIDDPFDEIWEDRPEIEFKPIELLEDLITGSATNTKYSELKERLSIEGPFAYIVSTCDDIAWLFNLRGSDIDYNPLALAYAVVTNMEMHLFCNIDSLTDKLHDYLTEHGVNIHGYYDFQEFIEDIPDNYTRIFAANKVTAKTFILAMDSGAGFMPDPTTGGTISLLKSVKNSVEIAGFKKAFFNDGVAWTKFLHFVETAPDIHNMTEYDLSQLMIKFRQENDDYMGESFYPIVAFGKNGALPHYSPYKGESDQIGNNNFLLIDTGAHYLYGTTDTTRTLPIGNITEEQKADYTMVLKGMIALSRAKFPKGTRGSQLDILARGPIMQRGKMYMHGTGHGIGHYLCVHEGPQSIRMEENSVTIKSGMVISNEPAVYQEGEYGIRIENVIHAVPYIKNSFNDFLSFETMTLVPIDKRAVNADLLAPEEMEWLNRYNKIVFDTIAVALTQEQREWFSSLYL